VFLPQDQAGWFGRSRFPARIVIMTADDLWIVPHPQSEEDPLIVPLDTLEELECGRILLLGWIGIRSKGVVSALHYNRRTHRPVEKFLARLKARWLEHSDLNVADRLCHYGPALEPKFQHALALEAAGDETMGIRFFQPPESREKRRLLLRFVDWAAGDLLTVFGRRVLWITDRHGRLQEPHGTLSRSAPLGSVTAIRYCLLDDKPHLQVVLQSGAVWNVAISEGRTLAAARFAEEVWECIGRAHLSAMSAHGGTTVP
jgi:hypothetical protein